MENGVKETKKNSKLIYIIIVVVLLIVIGILVYFLFTKEKYEINTDW